MPKSVKPLLARRDWTEWIASGRLRLLVGPDYRGASDAWRDIDAEAPQPPVVVHPVVLRECADIVASAQEIVGRIIGGARANLEARKRFAGPYLLNTLRNLTVISRAGDVASLSDRFRGLPAIVAGAGPSLDANLKDLRDVVDRAVLISTDTALRPLLSAGLDPQFVVAVDPQEFNARHLCGLPSCPNTWLV